MRTIDAHPVRFGELAGPLAHGAMVFDWELISTQEVATAFEYPFEDIVDADGIPYAPVVASTTVHRYPAFRDTVTVETTPRSVGDSSVELVYEMTDGDGDPLATARLTHVTIAPGGGALELPDDTREAFAEALEPDLEPSVGPDEDRDDADAPAISFESSFPIRSPHIEGSELAYFEEYPRFADAALEQFLEEQGTSLAELSGEKQPFRMRDWRWEFKSPVPYESTLTVETDVMAVEEDTVAVEHSLKSDDRVSIQGVTEYGCFTRTGEPVAFDDEMLAPFEGLAVEE